jgi:hypothetical protein
VYRWRLEQAGISVLRFDRRGRPIPFQATGTNVLPVEHRRWGTGNRHDIYHGMDVDRQGNIYYVAKADDPAKAGTDQTQQPVDIYGLPAWGSLIGRPGADKTRHQVDVYDSDGNPRKKGWVQLNSTRWIQVDEQGNLYALHKPSDAPWRYYLALSKFAPSGGQPVWSRRWESYAGQVETYVDNCMCVTARLHQALDDQGYLYAASEFSVQVIDCETGKLVGEFGSYGNMDCQGKGSRFPHPELPFGTISALSVWKDRLFAVDMLNRRIVKCRIERDSTKRDRSDRSNY